MGQMLPDYPDLKSQLQQKLNDWLRARVNFYSAPMSGVRETRVFEGSGTATLQSGALVRRKPFTKGQAEFEVAYSEVPTLTLDKVLERLDGAARELANQKMDLFFSTISEAAESAGNVVQATKGLTPEALLELFDKMQLEFDENGKISGLQAVLGPKQIQEMEETQRLIESDPNLKRRFDNVLARKRVEWRVREASRNLVG